MSSPVAVPTGEAALVGLVLETGDTSQLDRVHPGDFAQPTHGEMWATFQALAARSVPINAATVMAEATEQYPKQHVDLIERAVLAVVPNNYTPAAGSAFAETVLKAAARRRVQQAAQRLAHFAESNLDLDEVLDRMRAELTETATEIKRATGEKPIQGVSAA